MSVTTFAHGKQTRVYVGVYDVSRDLSSASAPINRDEEDATMFGDDDHVFQGTLRDGTIDLEGKWKADRDTVFDAADLVSIAPAGSAVGAPAIFGAVNDTKYETPSEATSLIGRKVSFRCADGPRRGRWLKDVGAVTADGNGTSVDWGAATTGPFAGGAHCFAVTTGTVDVFFEHSIDGSTWVVLDSVTFNTAPSTYYFSGTGQVERYRRVRWDVTGTTNISFAAAFASRN